MFSRRMVFLCSLTLAAGSAQATRVMIQVGGGTADTGECVLAVDQALTNLVAWSQGGHIHTYAINGDQEFDFTDHGPGADPDLCVTPTGFILAWISGLEVRLRHFDGGGWGEVVTLYGYGEPTSLALTGWQHNAEIDEAYLCWEDNEKNIWFSHGDAGSWPWGIFVRQGEHWEWEDMHPQALPMLTPWGIWPRIYHLNQDELVYMDGIGYAWSGSAAIPGSYGVDFSAAAGPGYSQHILGLGPQPVCPCNHITYTEWLPGGSWIAPEEITFNADFYDWPRYPALGVDAEGCAQAFWYQESRDDMMNVSGEGMYYFMRQAGAWVDASEELDGHIGIHCDLDMDEWGGASFVWSEENGGVYEIWLASWTILGAADDLPAASIPLSAYPNPFNPSTTIAFQLEAAATVSLTLHDAAGRRVRELVQQGDFAAGEAQVDWDGRDDSGRLMPSGVYLVRMETLGQEYSSRLVLLK